MKRFLSLIALAASLTAAAQSPFGLYTYANGGFAPAANGLGSGGLGYVPQPGYAYCKTAAGQPWTPCVSTGGSGGAPTPIAGALADYDFLQGTGTVLTDISGSGNDGTLGSGGFAPTWTATGLSFLDQQSVTLPATLNPSRTFYFAVYVNPLSSTPGDHLVDNQKPVLLNSTLDYQGLNILYGQNGANASSNIYSLALLGASTYPTFSQFSFAGFHVLAFTCSAPVPAGAWTTSISTGWRLRRHICLQGSFSPG